jgi:AraC family transcriptional activator of pobA
LQNKNSFLSFERINRKMQSIIQHKFSDLISDNFALELHVDNCVQIKNEDTKIYSSGRSDYFVIALLVKGSVNIKLNLHNNNVIQNTLLILSPNTIKQIINMSSDAELYLVAFTSKFLLQTGILKHEIDMIDFMFTSNDQTIVISKEHAEKLKNLVDTLKEKQFSKVDHIYGEDILKFSFRIFLYEIAAIGKKYNISSNIKRNRKQDLVMQFGNLLTLHFKEERSVKYYAEALSITPKYLSEVIVEITGKSASELIDEKVMFEIKVMLTNPQYNINQIADVLNFSDSAFLRKFFKRHSNISISDFRKHRI